MALNSQIHVDHTNVERETRFEMAAGLSHPRYSLR
jgi:hypothetical protein